MEPTLKQTASKPVHASVFKPLSLAAALLLTACGGGSVSIGGGDNGSSGSSANPLKVDESFGDKGSASFQLGDYGGGITGIVQQPDGKLLVVGSRRLESSAIASSEQSVLNKLARNVVFVSRLLENGRPDGSFGSSGTVELSFRGSDTIEDLLLMDDGSIVLAGNASEPCEYRVSAGSSCIKPDNSVAAQGVVLAKLSSGGVLDRSAAASGFVAVTQQLKSFPRLANQSGKVLLLLTTSYPQGQIFSWQLGRYSANGMLDTGFGNNGVVTSRCSTDGSQLLVNKQGGIWVVGARQLVSYVTPPATVGVCVEGFEANGARSAAAPEPLNTPLGANIQVTSARLLEGGGFMLGGSYAQEKERGAFALKYQSNGQLQGGYGAQGLASFPVTDASVRNAPRAVAISASGEVIAANFGESWGENSQGANAWVSLTSDGAADKRLDEDGLLIQKVAKDYTIVRTVLVDSKSRWLTLTQSGTANSRGDLLTATITRTQGMN